MFKREGMQTLCQNIIIQCSQILDTDLMNDFHLFSQFSNRNQIFLYGTMQCPHAIKYSIIFLDRHPSSYPFIHTGNSCQRVEILRNKQMPHLPDKVRIYSFRNNIPQIFRQFRHQTIHKCASFYNLLLQKINFTHNYMFLNYTYS